MGNILKKQVYYTPSLYCHKIVNDTIAELIRIASNHSRDYSTIPHRYTVYVMFRYMLNILKNNPDYDGFTNAFKKVAIEKATEAITAVSPCTGLLDVTLAIVCKEFRELAISLWDNEYTIEMTNTMLEEVREELMAKTWHPSRLRWCLDTEDAACMFGVVTS